MNDLGDGVHEDGPDDVPDVIGAQSVSLAIKGALLEGVLTQPDARRRGVLLEAIAAERWRTAVETDTGDVVLRLEVAVADGWAPVTRVHRAQLGLPFIDVERADLLALMALGAPDDASGLEELP